MSKISVAGERLHQIILAPVVSEKSTQAAENGNQAVFKVLANARKPEIKAAVEKMFNVKVRAVQTLNVSGKTRRSGRIEGRRADWKKAYVTLAEGQEIDFLGGANA